jgi:predicted metalloprotease with PDZ domain
MASCPCQKCSHVAQAYRAGLRDGDTVLSIDGESTEGMEMPERIKRLRGQDGVEVRLEAQQRGTVTVKTLTFKRGVVPQVIIEGWAELPTRQWDYMVGEVMAYINPLEIGSSAVHDLKQVE